MRPHPKLAPWHPIAGAALLGLAVSLPVGAFSPGGNAPASNTSNAGNPNNSRSNVTGAFNAKPPAPPAANVATAPPAHGAPGAPQADALPDKPGVVSWKTLAQVQPTKVKESIVPQFAKEVTALDAKEVKLQGFMMPLEMGDKQRHFMLAAMPPTCAFCMPGGPESVVEVRSKRPINYTIEPVLLSGKLSVLKSDPTGLYYRLSDAVPVAAK